MQPQDGRPQQLHACSVKSLRPRSFVRFASSFFAFGTPDAPADCRFYYPSPAAAALALASAPAPPLAFSLFDPTAGQTKFDKSIPHDVFHNAEGSQYDPITLPLS